MRTRPWLVAAVTLVGLAVTAPPAGAHTPVVLISGDAERSPIVGDGRAAVSAFGRLDRPGDVRALRIRLRAIDALRVDLLLPAGAPERDLASASLPRITVITPSGERSVLIPDRREPVAESAASGGPFVRVLRHSEPAEKGVTTLLVSGSAPARFALSTGTQEVTARFLRADPASPAQVAAWRTSPPVAVPAPRPPAPPPAAAPTTPTATPSPTPSPTTLASTEPAPASESVADEADGQSSAVAWLGLVALVLAAGAAVGVLVRRRRA